MHLTELDPEHDADVEEEHEHGHEHEVRRDQEDELRRKQGEVLREHEEPAYGEDWIRGEQDELAKEEDGIRREEDERSEEQDESRREQDGLSKGEGESRRERDELSREEHEVSKGEDALRRKQDELSNEEDELRRKQEELSNEEDELRREQDELSDEEDEVSREEDELRRTQDELSDEEDEVSREEDELRRTQDELSDEEDEVSREEDELRRTQDELSDEEDEVSKEEDELRRTQDELSDEEDEVSREEDELRRTQDELSDEEDEVSREQDELRRTQDEVSREQDDVSREQDDVSREQDDVSRERDDVSRERDDVSRERDDVSRERDEVSREEEEVSRDVDELRRHQEELSKEQDDLPSERDEVLREQDELSPEEDEKDPTHIKQTGPSGTFSRSLPMLDRIALHQTRLRTPGLGLDAKGIALGAKGLVLVPTVDRLVGWLSVYTRERSLEDLLSSLELRFVRSPMGTQEITITFAAESSDRMDRVAETARLVGAFTFTGTTRHFVQYRDAAAPFGYDSSELLSTDAPLALYHDRFSQTYDDGKPVDLRALLLRLMPHADPTAAPEPGTRYVVAEEGLGPALIHYLVRSQVEADVTLGEWPPASAFDETPIRRYIFRIPELPPRMRRLMHETPGLTSFLPRGPGVAVEIGFRHPIQLRACPVFDPGGLVLLRGRGDEPWTLPHLPVFGDVRSFARVELRDGDAVPAAIARRTTESGAVRVPIRLVPASSPWRNVTASWIATDKLPLLRRIAYALGPSTLRETRVALTDRGAFLSCPHGIEAIPIGTFFLEIHPGLFTPVGLDVVPKVAPEVLYRALGAPQGHAIFLSHNGTALAIPNDAFVSLETAVLEAKSWEPATAELIESALLEAPLELVLSPVGLFPLRGAAAITDKKEALALPEAELPAPSPDGGVDG